MRTLGSTIARHLLTLVPLLALSACGGGSDGGTTSPGGNTSGFHFTAKIDGAAWASLNPSLISANQVLPGEYTLGGFDASSTNINFSMYNIRGPGTYPIGVGPQVPGASVIIANSSGAGWATPQSGADGTLTITSLSTTEMVGTFNFSATPLSGGATGTKTVTSGDFDVPVKQLVAIGPIPDNAGSTMSAAIGGASWNGASVFGSVQTSAFGGSTLVAGATNNLRGMGFTISNFTGVGTYALGNVNGVTREMHVANVANVLSNSWSSLGNGSSGSITVTSVTATRIKGTFSGVLGPFPGFSTVGTIAVSNGTFDIGLQ